MIPAKFQGKRTLGSAWRGKYFNACNHSIGAFDLDHFVKTFVPPCQGGNILTYVTIT